MLAPAYTIYTHVGPSIYNEYMNPDFVWRKETVIICVIVVKTVVSLQKTVKFQYVYTNVNESRFFLKKRKCLKISYNNQNIDYKQNDGENN